MTTNTETLALDDTRHDDIDPAGETGGLETKAGRGRVPAPAVRRTDPASTIARTIRAQGEEIREMKQTLTRQQAEQRLANLRMRQRGTAEIRSALPRVTRRADPLDQHRVNRTIAAVTARETRADQRLVAENRRLQREIETRDRQMRRPPLMRSGAGGSGYSAKSQAFAFHKKCVAQYLKTGETTFGGMTLQQIERKAGLHTESNPNGGYLVHPEHDTGPLQSILYDTVVMRQVSTIKPVSGFSFTMPYDIGGEDANWVGEREQRSETNTPNIVELEYPVMELEAKPKASQRLLDDAYFDVEAWLADKVAKQFARKEEMAFTAGDGVKKPKGFLAYDKIANGSWAWGKIGFVVTGADGAFASPTVALNQGDSLVNLMFALRPSYRANAKFMANSATAGIMRTLKDGEGRWIWNDARDGMPSTLFGNHEVVYNEEMPNIGSGAFALAFGDFKAGYIVVDRLGLRVLRDPYSAKPFIEFYTTARVGGGVKDFEAIKLLKFATS